MGEQIEALEGVDRKLKQALEDGAARLEEVIVECEESTTEAIAPATIPIEPEEDEGKGRRKKPKEKEEKPKDEGETDDGNPAQLPPQAKGEGKGLEDGHGRRRPKKTPRTRPKARPAGSARAAPAGGGD